jgi:ketosteroid isomerase-like protein
MSEANVEVVKRGIDAFNRGDVDAFAGLTTFDFEWFPALDSAVERRDFRGREGIEAWYEAASEAWQEFCALPDVFRDLGDCVLWLGRLEGRGRGSGVQVTAPIAVIADFREGKIARLRSFFDHDEALRAAGLAE